MFTPTYKTVKGFLTPQTRIQEGFGSNLGREIGRPEVNHEFPRSLQATSGIGPPLGHDRFLPNPFTGILPFDATWSWYSAVKYPRRPHFFPWVGVRLSPLGTSTTVWPIAPTLPDDGWWWWAWSNRCNGNWQGKPKYSKKTCPQCHFFHHKSDMTWPLGSNPDRRGGKPAIDRLRYGRAYTEFRAYLLSLLSCKNFFHSSLLPLFCLRHCIEQSDVFMFEIRQTRGS
jgi:hypothetical protein